MNTAVRTLAAAVAFTVLLFAVWILRPGTEPTVRDEPSPPAYVATVERRRETVTAMPRRRATAEPDSEAEPLTPVAVADRSTTATAHRYEGVVVHAALGWFARRQRDGGGWGDAGATGGALLAFLGAGETTTSGSHREMVANAFARLAPDADGRLAPRDAPHFLREHALAALALTELYGMTSHKSRLEPARRALGFALAQRAPGGGWNLAAPRETELDLETTVWMAMLVKSAQLSDVPVDTALLGDVVTAIDRITDPATGRITPPAGCALSGDAANAAAAVVRILAGRCERDDPALVTAGDLIRTKLPSGDASDVVADTQYCYFGTLAAFQFGGQTWSRWNAAMQTGMLDRQRAEDGDDERGSWDPAHAGATEADRLATTVLLTLGTEVRFRYPRLTPLDPGTARPR